MGKIYVVGMGPGNSEFMTQQAANALQAADVIIGYTVYIDLLRPEWSHKQLLATGMRQEKERCELCLQRALAGETVSLVCSGDAGVYGMASLVLELRGDCAEPEIEIVPGITAALSGAAVLGAPLNHDFCLISLSDLMTPWQTIEKRLLCAAEADFSIALYNPSSHHRPDHLRRACEILLQVAEPERACGYVENIGRANEQAAVCTLAELKDREVNMFTTVFIGSSQTRILQGKLVTPRGYKVNE